MNIFWAIKMESGDFYIGTRLTRRSAIAAHTDGRWRFHENSSGWRPLTPEQKADWEKCRRQGDRVVKVRVVEVTP